MGGNYEQKTIRTQSADEKANQKEIEIYHIPLNVNIPTEKLDTHFFLYKLFGVKYGGYSYKPHEDSIIISPTGGIAKEEYYKPLGELRIDNPEGGGSYMGTAENGKYLYKHTKEDSEGYWALNNPEFREKLRGLGWAIFEKPEPLDNSKINSLELEKDRSYLKKDVSLPETITVMELFNEKKYEFFLNDLAELASMVPEIEYIYKTNFDTAMGRAEVSHGDKRLEMRIEGFEKMRPLGEDSPSYIEESKPLRKTIMLGTPFDGRGFSDSAPSWWTEEMTNRVDILTREYIKDAGIIISKFSPSKGYLNIDISNRRTCDKEVKVHTRELLDQAISLDNVVKTLIKFEHEDYDSKKDAVLDERRTRMLNEANIDIN
jgi:hypothetical protein